MILINNPEFMDGKDYDCGIMLVFFRWMSWDQKLSSSELLLLSARDSYMPITHIYKTLAL